MTKAYTFDVETNGLLDTLTEIKCLNIIDCEGNERRYSDYPYYLDAYTGELTDVMHSKHGTIVDGLQFLNTADEISGHNIIGFDIPAIQKVHPDWKPTAAIFDTVVVARLLYPDVQERDAIAERKGKFTMPKNLRHGHSLEAWGIRLGGEQKGSFKPSDYGHTWTDYPFSKQCDDYCMQDVVTNVGLVAHFKKRLEETGVPMACIELEQDVGRIISRQEKYGWLYDIKAAEALTVELMKEKLELEAQLIDTFGEFQMKNGKPFTPKRDNKKLGYKKGVTVQRYKTVLFNPGSRDHIAMRLTAEFGWEPDEFTPNGKPKVDETTLSKLDYPEAKLCVKYFKTNKMLSQVSEGKMAQLKLVRKDGRIHGRVNSNGAVTGRMTHSSPNVAQTDKDARVRALYIVPEGKKLVGCDADGLELRCLAHFLFKFDGGKYVAVVLDGNKADGTDIHTRNQKAVGLMEREAAKRLFYGWAYGAGDLKMGTIIYEDDWPADKQERFNARFKGAGRTKKLVMIGRKARAALVAGITGMDKLIKKVKAKAKSPGYVRGLDKRRVSCRSQHAALNTLLQSAGALIMKKALVILDDHLQNIGLLPGTDYEFCGNIHDELQIEAKESHAERIGKDAALAIEHAGEYFKFRCPLSGDYAVGDNWSQTH